MLSQPEQPRRAKLHPLLYPHLLVRHPTDGVAYVIARGGGLAAGHPSY
jgi:hypothetical protein|eukprot:COSAG02_NODE_1102_length_14571_cov_27.965243_13_plen_48_part_00